MSNDTPMRTTAEGERLVKNWKRAQDYLNTAQREAWRAQHDVNDSANALDPKVGEKAAVWFLDTLIEAELVEAHPEKFKVSLRERGREFNKL